MRKNFKRILSALLLVIMLVGVIPFNTFAANDSEEYDWQGKWIWTSDAVPTSGQVGQFINMRKTFTLKKVPDSAVSRIAVQSRYWMWINGEMVVYEGQLNMGPDKNSWYYDTVDIAPYLKEGENIIAILGAYYAHQSASTKPTKNPALLFDAEFFAGALAKGTRLVSDESWKVILNNAYGPSDYTHKNVKPDGALTKYDANKAIKFEGWQTLEFDDSTWKSATVKTLTSTDPRNNLVERAIPMWKVEDVLKHDKSTWTVTDKGNENADVLSLPEEYTVTAEIKSLQGNVCVSVCVGEDKNYYIPRIQKSGSGLTIYPLRKDGSSWKSPSLLEGATETGVLTDKMTVEIEVKGDSITTYINNTKVGRFTDSTLARKGRGIGFHTADDQQIAVYSVKVTDTEGKLLWEDTISEAKAGDRITDFKKLSGSTDLTLKTDENGTTYMHVPTGGIFAAAQPSDEPSEKVYSFYNATNMQGSPYLKVRSTTGGEMIKLSTDSASEPGVESIVHQYVTKPGEQEYEAYGWMNGWRVDFTMPASVEVLELGWRETSYNTEHTGNVTTSNEDLNLLYQKAYDTLLVTMRDIYMDCPDVERQQWWGDAVLEMQQAAYAMDDNARLLYKKLLMQVLGWSEGHGGALTEVAGNINFGEMPAQCLAGVHTLWQYYLYYGETDILETCYEPFMTYLKLWYFDETGEMNHRTGNSDWYDWGANIDAGVQDYCWYYLATESMRNVAKILGKDQADIKFLEDRMELMEECFVSMFWHEDIGAYFSNTTTGTPDERAQAMAVYSGLADPAHYPSILNLYNKTTNKTAAPYGEKYILESLYIMGYTDEAIARTLDRYGPMLHDEYPTLFEMFALSAASGHGGVQTRNHAWSGGPLSLMYMYNAGITSTGAGFKTFKIRPQLGSLTNISAHTDTTNGLIEMSATKNSLNVTVPTGCTYAEICVPRLDTATTIKLGGIIVYANGKAVSNLPAGVTYVGEDADYVTFKVVAGTYSFTMEADATSSASSHTITISAIGNGTVKVNGETVQLHYTYTGSGSITITATPNAGSRVAYVAGSVTEKIYSETAVERTYALNNNMGITVCFDEPKTNDPVIRIIDASKDSSTTSSVKGMFYAYRLYVNGKEVHMDFYTREKYLPLPYVVTAEKGEKVTVAIKPIDERNYNVWFDDGTLSPKREITYTMGEDVTLKINVTERNTAKKIPIVDVTSSSESSKYPATSLTDGDRTNGFSNNYFSSGSFGTATPTKPIVITLDLGKAEMINQVSAFPRPVYSETGGARGFMKDFTISVSTDGKNYTEVAKIEDQADPYMQQQTYNFGDVLARYVQIKVTEIATSDWVIAGSVPYRLYLQELEVAYTKKVAPPAWAAPYEEPSGDPSEEPSGDDTPVDTQDTGTDTTNVDNGGNSNKKGCGSTVSGGFAMILSMATAVCICRKKKKD